MQWTMELCKLGNPGRCEASLLTILGGMLGQWGMEKNFSHPHPGLRNLGNIYLPVGVWAMGNGANGGSNETSKDIQ